MSALDYSAPPVHEVVLDVQFHEPIGEDRLEPLPERIGGRFGTPQRVNEVEMQISWGPGLDKTATPKQSFGGWRFESGNPRWVVQAMRSQFSLHAVRSEKWPRGAYIGWDAVRAKYEEVFRLISEPYANCVPKRWGLRYLNRIAVPEGTDLDDWFLIGPRSPETLDGLFAFDVQHTWASAAGHKDIGARVRLAQIRIEDELLAVGNVGVLLDIDIFNLWVKDAPALKDAMNWFARAHDIENTVFESCITDKLRVSFGVAHADKR